MAHHQQADVPKKITPIFLPSRAPELNPVENVWQYLRQNWLSNTVFENYDAIVDAACAAWRKLIAKGSRPLECATGLTSVSRYDSEYKRVLKKLVRRPRRYY
jgi:transposase